MRFEPGRRSVAMSVGEFATFRPGPSGVAGGRTGAWRAAVGSAWHKELRERATTAEPGARFEVPLQGLLMHRGWTIELQGRLDQVVQRGDTMVLREVKTVSRSLPIPADELASDYPEYFLQLAAYVRLASLDGSLNAVARIEGELIFVDYAGGTLQTVPLDQRDAEVKVESQFNVLLPYLEYTHGTDSRLAAMPAVTAFAVSRPGQDDARVDLRAAAGHAGVAIFEAPTGFGKTGLLLEYALERLRDGRSRRLIYLTGKGTGQAPVTKQLRAMLGDDPPIRLIQLRSRTEHAISTPRHDCHARGGCRTDIEERWLASGIDPQSLFEDGSLPLEKSRTLGAQTGVCPYEITRAALPYAEVWVCDYNYIFSPPHRGLLFNVPGFDAGRTILVLDEAHNLPARAADARSHTFTAADASEALHSLRSARARQVLVKAMENLVEFLEPLRPSQQRDLTAAYTLADLLEAIASELRAGPLPEDVSEDTADFLWNSTEALVSLRDESLELFPWTPSPSQLRLSCLDAAPAIAAALREFGQAVLTSATFGPQDLFLASCGLDKNETAWISAHAPWRDGAYTIAVDARVDTRLRSRHLHYATTADTVRLLAAGQPRPVAVFFPSYDYAEAVRTYLQAEDPGTRVAMQPRGATFAEQMEFLDEALLISHAIFLVLGGSFAEGIDRLGGEVSRAMVVGPALPEPNPVVEARRARIEETLGRDEAFRRCFLAPGMLKVAQALGRLVRAPGQRARVLLQCKRFTEADIQALLPSDYRSRTIIRNDASLAQWLDKPD